MTTNANYALERQGVEGPWGKGDKQAYVQIALITPADHHPYAHLQRGPRDRTHGCYLYLAGLRVEQRVSAAPQGLSKLLPLRA